MRSRYCFIVIGGALNQSETYSKGAAASRQQRAFGSFPNPTHGRVGGSFKSSLHAKAPRPPLNPTHGSGWIVQVQPTEGHRDLFLVSALPSPCIARAMTNKARRPALFVGGLERPPTPVGGIQRMGSRRLRV